MFSGFNYETASTICFAMISNMSSGKGPMKSTNYFKDPPFMLSVTMERHPSGRFQKT